MFLGDAGHCELEFARALLLHVRLHGQLNDETIAADNRSMTWEARVTELQVP